MIKASSKEARRREGLVIVHTGDGKGKTTSALRGLWASFVHVHYASKPELAVRFVEACERAKEG